MSWVFINFSIQTASGITSHNHLYLANFIVLKEIIFFTTCMRFPLNKYQEKYYLLFFQWSDKIFPSTRWFTSFVMTHKRIKLKKCVNKNNVLCHVFTRNEYKLCCYTNLVVCFWYIFWNQSWELLSNIYSYFKFSIHGSDTFRLYGFWWQIVTCRCPCRRKLFIVVTPTFKNSITLKFMPHI